MEITVDRFLLINDDVNPGHILKILCVMAFENVDHTGEKNA